MTFYLLLLALKGNKLAFQKRQVLYITVSLRCRLLLMAAGFRVVVVIRHVLRVEVALVFDMKQQRLIYVRHWQSMQTDQEYSVPMAHAASASKDLRFWRIEEGGAVA